MKLVQQTVQDFVSLVNSSSPAPGGGSVSALSGSLAAALARMVGHLTIHKKAFATLSRDDQAMFHASFEALDSLSKELEGLVDKDTDAFNAIMSAYKLPKQTDKDKQIRRQAIQDATILATEVPLSVARKSNEVLDHLPVFISRGNKNCLSDVGVAVLQAKSAIQGALMNVKINLPGIKNETIKKTYQAELDTLWQQSLDADQLINTIMKSL